MYFTNIFWHGIYDILWDVATVAIVTTSRAILHFYTLLLHWCFSSSWSNVIHFCCNNIYLYINARRLYYIAICGNFFFLPHGAMWYTFIAMIFFFDEYEYFSTDISYCIDIFIATYRNVIHFFCIHFFSSTKGNMIQL